MEKYYCEHCRTLSDRIGKCNQCGKEIQQKIEIQVQYQENSGSNLKGV